MSKPDLLLVSPIHGPTQAQLDADYTVHRYWEAADKPALLAKLAPTCVAAATSGGAGIKAQVIRALPGLKIVACFGVGYDGVDLAACKERGIRVTNTPDVLNECVADTTWMLILATVRRAVFNDKYVRSGKWLGGSAPLTDKVWGETLGIVGLGRIGKAIARRAEGFGMQVVYHGRHRQPDVAYEYFADLKAMARAVKILVLILPGGKATENLVDAEVLAALGPQGYLINVSRGSNVDEAAVLKALQDKTIAGAGLDVFVDEPRVPEAFFALDNVVLQPHVGSGTVATRNAMGQLVVDNLAAFFAGRALLTEVPETRG
ncbi:MAG: 2-hydroxyacid dehydrogenase [Burkholderiales bacterium]|nr:2-hydroxyacid dehydrogenase [Burkholderiales bacterium]